MFMIFSAVLVLAAIQVVDAHVAPFAKGMYCLNGVNGQNINAEEAVNPVYKMSYNDYWMHANTGCLNAPPKEDDFLVLPAGRSFTVEVASNQAFTSLSYDGKKAGLWPDGADHSDLDGERKDCINTPNLHAQNRSMAAGTAFAISYTSDISQVNEDNLVVFTVLKESPWYREATYQVPADMPECPEGGCICAWGWIPYHCGIPNMYMHPYRCKVTGATGHNAVGKPQNPEWCEDDQSRCVAGPKKFLIWNQLEGNTVEVDGYDLAGQERSPGYNVRMGFIDGAQNDIFTGGVIGGYSSPPSTNSQSSSPSKTTELSESPHSESVDVAATSASSSTTSTDTAIPSSDPAPIPPSNSSYPSSISSTATCRRRRRRSHRRHLALYNSW